MIQIALETERAVSLEGLNVATISNNLTRIQQVHEFVTHVLGETPTLRDNDLLVTRELSTSSSEGFDGSFSLAIGGSDGVDDISTSDTSAKTIRLTVSTTHTSLQSISTSAGQHLVDTQDVERVSSDSHVEGVLAELLEVLVSTDTAGFESFRRDLVVLARQQMDAEREFSDISLLVTQIEDFDFRFRDTTAKTRLDVRFASNSSVATSWS